MARRDAVEEPVSSERFHSDLRRASAPLVPMAQRIAGQAHLGQLDKRGRPYIEHPYRVAERMTSDEARAVAWLHDVVEDSEWTCDDLIAEGIPMDVVVAVAAITYSRGETRSEYYARVKANPLALEVKLADIADNLDPRRLLALPAETMVRLMRKYADALEALT